MRTAIDTNVLSELVSGTSGAEQAARALGGAQHVGALVICGAVYAELRASPWFRGVSVDDYLRQRYIDIDYECGADVWRLAAESFVGYTVRRRMSSGGEAKRFLADYFIGAHAQVRADRLLTFDKERYSAAFPNLRMEP